MRICVDEIEERWLVLLLVLLAVECIIFLVWDVEAIQNIEITCTLYLRERLQTESDTS